jgi:hypothetical protein
MLKRSDNMKPVSVPSTSKTLNSLLKKARRRNVILESADGDRFVLAAIPDWQGFTVGNSQDFSAEVQRTTQNKDLAKLVSKRRAKDKARPGFSAEEVKKQLGLK